MKKQPGSLTIYYDDDCPFCSSYVSHLRIKKSAGTPKLIRLREDEKSKKMLQKKDYSLDDGMVVEYGGAYYHGSDAIHMLGLLSTPSGIFNRINALVFSSKLLAKILYPLLRAGRNASLFALGRKPIEQEQRTQLTDQYALFAFMYGLFGVYHFIIYATEYLEIVYISGWLTLVSGFLLVLNPLSKRLFVLLTISLLVDGWSHAPMTSNHTIIKNFLVLAIALAGLWHWLANKRSWEKFYESFAPIGRCLLLVMYFYGIFHKLNTDFLNPEYSCATALLKQMPLLAMVADQLWAQYLAIYSTFVIEGIVIFCLLVRRYHYYGVTIGILFHIILAASGYQFYATFSTLSILLHTLFIPKQALSNFRQTSGWQWLINPQNRVFQYVIIAAFIFIQLSVTTLSHFLPLNMVRFLPWLVFASLFFTFVVLNARTKDQPYERTQLISRTWALNIITIIFILNCASPYLGLKTRQSINMFANLHVENGQSNHLIIKHIPTYFNYINDVVEITYASTGSDIHKFGKLGYNLVYYELLNLLEKEPETRVSFVRNGRLFENQSYESLKGDAEKILHPQWVRKWLHFNPVSPASPKACSYYN